jgi:hypothetical protein
LLVAVDLIFPAPYRVTLTLVLVLVHHVIAS